MDSPQNSEQKCFCDKTNTGTQRNDQIVTSGPLNKSKSRSKIALSLLNFKLRKSKLTLKRIKNTSEHEIGMSSDPTSKGAIKKSKWGLKFPTARKDPKIIESNDDKPNCNCSPKEKEATEVDEKKEECPSSSKEDTVASPDQPNSPNNNVVQVQEVEIREHSIRSGGNNKLIVENIYGSAPVQQSLVIDAPFLDMHCLRTFHEDCDEAARLIRAREIEQGVKAPANFKPVVQLVCSDIEENGQKPRRLQLVCPPDLSVDSLKALFQNNVTIRSSPIDNYTGCHTQVDFIHCLVPDLYNITNCSFYWGKIDRYEAERLLDGKPEGTFLLRDSAQEEFLFSVSFRKYERSLHARIEQWNHKFSFDSHDPGVFTSDTVCGLIEHYKDPSGCMFFEPTLTCPLHRNFPFGLQHLARSVIVSRLAYDDINQLQLPKTLKTYLKEYHYRQKVRVERFDDDMQWLELQNM